MPAEAASVVWAENSDPRSLAEKAYQLLMHKITRLELAPGAPLTDKVLTAELGIGRTPVREALQRLAGEGLVNHLPNRGMFVSDISAVSVQHIYEFRSIIDGHAARLAASRASDRDVEELRSTQSRLVEATDNENLDAFVDHDRHFYAVLARAAQNTYLAETIPRLFNLHLRLWFLISQKAGSWHDIASAHHDMTQGVIDAIARRDPDAAELAIKMYVSRRHQDIRDFM